MAEGRAEDRTDRGGGPGTRHGNGGAAMTGARPPGRNGDAPALPERYEPEAVEAAAQAYWEEAQTFRVTEDPLPREVLLPLDVPLPERAPAHGPRPQLHDRRRGLSLPADARQERAPADGMGRLRASGRERGDREPGAAREVDVPQHRGHEGPAPAARLRLRLVPRVRHLHPGLLPLGAVDVRPDVREGTRLQAQRGGQLGSGRRHRARQRAGHRRPRLALGRPGRAARDPPLVPQDHGLRGRAPRRARHNRLAGRGQDHAAQLDRALGGCRVRLRARRRGRNHLRVHDAPRHDLRRHVHGRRDRSPARGGGGRRGPRGGRVHRRMPADGDLRGVARDHGEAGHRHRPERDPPDDRGGDPDLDRELRPHELRHGRDHGGARPRPPRPRVRDPVRSSHRAGDPPVGRRRRRHFHGGVRRAGESSWRRANSTA